MDLFFFCVSQWDRDSPLKISPGLRVDPHCDSQLYTEVFFSLYSLPVHIEINCIMIINFLRDFVMNESERVESFID